MHRVALLTKIRNICSNDKVLKLLNLVADQLKQLNNISIYSQFFLELIAIIILVSMVNLWLLVPTFVMSLLFYGLRHVYVNTARCIKRVEALSKFK